MFNEPLVSIILPCYNAAVTLKATLASIAKQSYRNFELIFINDGSTDTSLKIAEEFSHQVNINIKIISRENKGFLKSLEEGIDCSSGKYIARIDADDIWRYDHLELVLDEFLKNELLVLVGSNAKYIDDKMTIIGFTNQANSYEETIKYMLKDSPFIHSSVVFKKEAYLKTKGYFIGSDDGSKHIADYNLWVELSCIGECKNIADYTVLYRVLENSMSRKMNKCMNYSARLSVMKKAYQLHRKYHCYYLFQQLKVKLRLIQHCILKGKQNEKS